MIEPSFQGINRFFGLLFENNAHRTIHKRYFLPTVEIKDYNVMISGRTIRSIQNVRNNIRAYENIKKLLMD